MAYHDCDSDQTHLKPHVRDSTISDDRKITLLNVITGVRTRGAGGGGGTIAPPVIRLGGQSPSDF